MNWTPELDQEFARTFPVIREEDAVRSSQPRQDDPVGGFEWVFVILTLLTTAVWIGILGLLGWGVISFFRGVVGKLF